VQRQATLGKSLRQSRQNLLGLLSRSAMAQSIVRIPLQRYVRMMALYPLVEHVVQEQVGQPWITPPCGVPSARTCV
jgi:hypothetical protein